MIIHEFRQADKDYLHGLVLSDREQLFANIKIVGGKHTPWWYGGSKDVIAVLELNLDINDDTMNCGRTLTLFQSVYADQTVARYSCFGRIAALVDHEFWRFVSNCGETSDEFVKSNYKQLREVSDIFKRIVVGV